MTLATFLVLSAGLAYGVYRLIVWQSHQPTRRATRPGARRDAVVSDAVVSDAVVTDAVVTDAVVTDAVVSDAVISEDTADAILGESWLNQSPLAEEARRTGAPEPRFVLGSPLPDSLMRSLNIIAGVVAIAFLALLVGAGLMVLSFCASLASMG
jgi:hypothetical protein